MTGFLISCALIGIAVVAFSVKRRREIDAFMAADLVDLSAGEQDQEANESAAWGEARVVGQTAAAPSSVVAIGTDYQIEEIATFRQKDGVFDDVTRSFLTALDQVLDDHYRAFAQVPVKELVKEVSPGKVPAPAMEKVVSIVICKKSNLSLVCGILLHDKSPRARHQSWLLENVFTQIGRPLLSFPLETDYSPAEIDEQLDKVMHRSFLNRNCPRCGANMALKKALRGKNSGRSFWVCRNFPDCRGIVSIST
jgi:hypothetical protein|tara:strand:+ start:13297 stop:14052 length:756 start_codon:yes stop_codon:yes gene_type:complete